MLAVRPSSLNQSVSQQIMNAPWTEGPRELLQHAAESGLVLMVLVSRIQFPATPGAPRIWKSE